MSDNLLNKLTQLKLPAMAGSLIRQRETPQTYDELSFIDRNLNPQKTKKAPQNGCFFNTPCAPYERKRLLNRMTLIDS
ncbi:hypothetical protein MXE68_27695, partial [Escherichia coli]|nr:hypothetical protein [Escherichia coli]